MKWGEDFGLFTEHFKGAMFGLGSGTEQPALHNPDYDFPDALLETGSVMFEAIVRDFLAGK
jgi:metal-dependent amidase/aminoacylase/carboxypeptidase family protein